MQVPVSWLGEYVEIKHTIEALAEVLTNAGLEVKTIDYIGIPGADLEWERDKLFLAQVIEVEQHPDADKLVLATVEYGANRPKTVVTGAPNLFQYVGAGDLTERRIFSPLILEGATYYDPYKNKRKTTLKGRPLRGIYNDAMLCSEVEIGLGDGHDGIILIQEDAYGPKYVPGTPLADVLGDAVLEIDIIPNIARCASIVGVAREYAALTGQTVRYPSYDVVMEGARVGDRIVITTGNPEFNPRFCALLIEGVSQKPAPYWMQRRLKLAGQRPINVMVDISNYVMLEMGQPNHAFDYDFLRRRADAYAPDGPVQIITRLPHDGETLTTLDGEVHKLLPESILVTDPLGNLSLGGIMGGLDSEIKDETTNVLLEAAAWNFINIRKTGTALGMHTDAYFRFSRGVHPSQALLGAKRAAELMRVLAGGTVARGIIDTYPDVPETVVVDLDPVYVRRLSGLDLDSAEITTLLQRLEFTVEPNGALLRVTVPDHRMDIDGRHDLVEEICRVYGYDRIPSTIIADALPPQRGNPELEGEELIKDLLAQQGLQEIITYRLTSPELENKMLVTTAPDDRPYVKLTNPISPERRVLRHNLLASVLDIVARNSRYQERICVYEIGQIFLVDEEEILPEEAAYLALAMTGLRTNAHWQQDDSAWIDFYDLKGVLEALFGRLRVSVTYEASTHPSYRPGRTAKLLIDGQQVGWMGELHPLVAEALDIRLEKGQGVYAAELNLPNLLAAIPGQTLFRPMSAYPAVREDIALIVDSTIPSATVEAEIIKAGGYLLQSAELFDVYTGSQLSPGKKSLAYHLTFQSPNKTLTDKETGKQRQRIVRQLENTLGARLRE
ncbi:MAG: phenylalanine--tRNA ligase subunit beta [Anaerolineae bacterium]|nr:phenylalanine--tRNA ligase subunit beta [Anaerolineae bacterium]